MDSLTGAVRLWKGIEYSDIQIKFHKSLRDIQLNIMGPQSSAHSGQKSEVECKCKSRIDWIPLSVESNRESVN